MIGAPLSSATTALPIAILAVLALGVAVLYSLRIAYTLLEGYRTASSAAAGYVAVGLLLLTTVPIVVRFVVATWGLLSPTLINALAAASELLGLLAIVVGIYRPGGER